MPPQLFSPQNKLFLTNIVFAKHLIIKHFSFSQIFIFSVPSKAVCHEIGPVLWKIGSTDFVILGEKDAFSWEFT